MMQKISALAVFTWLALSCGLAAAATLTLTVQADSTIAGNPGKVMYEEFVESGSPAEISGFLVFQEAGKHRLYASNEEGGPWDVIPSAIYIVPVSSMTVGETWVGLPDDLGTATTAMVGAIESVTVPAGTFANAYRVDIRPDGAGPGSQPLEQFWFVSGVGFVRNVGFFADGSPDYTQELVSYSGSGTGFFPGDVGNVWVYDEQPGGVVADVGDTAVPARAALLAAYPNPFNPTTELAFELTVPGTARLRIYDTAGRLVTTLVDGHQAEGRHEVTWNGRDAGGRQVASGVYLYRLESGKTVQTRRMTLVK